MALGVAAITGGLLSGRIADRWGYEALFVMVSLSQPVALIAGFFLLDPRLEAARTTAETTPIRLFGLSRSLVLLLIANVLANAINSSGGLGRPLRMNALAFDATAISTTAAAAGFITLPLPFVVGWLSDRIGRRRLLIVCYLSASIGIFLLAFAQELWQFWLSTILLTVVASSMALGSALITDIVPRSSLDTALSRFSATPWLGSVIGFGGTGLVIQAVGSQTTFLLAALLPLIAIAMLLFIRRSVQPDPV
jgi:MFS family permease